MRCHHCRRRGRIACSLHCVASARYSIAKLRDFDQYARTTSTSRHLAVILLTPLPSLLPSLLPTAIALQDPTLGVLQNPGFLFNFFTTLGFISLGSVFQFRGSCGWSSRDISVGGALVIADLSSLQLTVFVALLGYVWRFLVSFFFTWVVAYGPFVIAAHALVLRGKLGPNSTISGPLLPFLPSYFIKGCQVVIYPAFSALFEMCNELGQVAMTLLFPVIKFVFRGIVRRLSSHLVDNAEEAAVSGVEICSAMYQSMIMQNSPPPFTTALVIGVDMVQGLFAIYVFMLQRSVVPLSDVVDTACAVVGRDPRQRERRISTDVELTAYATIKALPLATWCPRGRGNRQRRVVPHVAPHVAPHLAAIVLPRREPARHTCTGDRAVSRVDSDHGVL